MGSYKWVISPLIWIVSIVTLLITLLITAHEPPSATIFPTQHWQHAAQSPGSGCLSMGLRVLGVEGSEFRV